MTVAPVKPSRQLGRRLGREAVAMHNRRMAEVPADHAADVSFSWRKAYVPKGEGHAVTASWRGIEFLVAQLVVSGQYRLYVTRNDRPVRLPGNRDAYVIGRDNAERAMRAHIDNRRAVELDARAAVAAAAAKPAKKWRPARRVSLRLNVKPDADGFTIGAFCVGDVVQWTDTEHRTPREFTGQIWSEAGNDASRTDSTPMTGYHVVVQAVNGETVARPRAVRMVYAQTPGGTLGWFVGDSLVSSIGAESGAAQLDMFQTETDKRNAERDRLDDEFHAIVAAEQTAAETAPPAVVEAVVEPVVEPAPAERPTEELSVQYSYGWRRDYSNYDPSACIRGVQCGGQLYTVGRILPEGYPVTVRTSAGGYVATCREAEVNGVVLAHRTAELSTAAPVVEPVVEAAPVTRGARVQQVKPYMSPVIGEGVREIIQRGTVTRDESDRNGVRQQWVRWDGVASEEPYAPGVLVRVVETDVEAERKRFGFAVGDEVKQGPSADDQRSGLVVEGRKGDANYGRRVRVYWADGRSGWCESVHLLTATGDAPAGRAPVVIQRTPEIGRSEGIEPMNPGRDQNWWRFTSEEGFAYEVSYRADRKPEPWRAMTADGHRYVGSGLCSGALLGTVREHSAAQAEKSARAVRRPAVESAPAVVEAVVEVTAQPAAAVVESAPAAAVEPTVEASPETAPAVVEAVVERLVEAAVERVLGLVLQRIEGVPMVAEPVVEAVVERVLERLAAGAARVERPGRSAAGPVRAQRRGGRTGGRKARAR